MLFCTEDDDAIHSTLDRAGMSEAEIDSYVVNAQEKENPKGV